jgi:hypothetical protein
MDTCNIFTNSVQNYDGGPISRVMVRIETGRFLTTTDSLVGWDASVKFTAVMTFPFFPKGKLHLKTFLFLCLTASWNNAGYPDVGMLLCDYHMICHVICHVSCHVVYYVT